MDDPILDAALAGIVAVAANAAKETTNTLATAAWGKIKGVLGWKTDPAPAEIESKARAALAANPAAAAQVHSIVNEYTQQIGAVNVGTLGSIDLRGATVQTVKQASVGHNSGSISL
jgi:hypothetical protein